MALCPACQVSREHLINAMRTPWECVLSRYEFMIVLASFRRNIHFYSAMDRGQLKTAYSQIVSFSPARMLVADSLISTYNKREREEESNLIRCPAHPERSSPSHPRTSLSIPCELSEAATFALGNGVPKQFVYECIAEQTWKGYEEMVLATLASVDVVRGGALKYLTLLRSSTRNVSALHTIAGLAIAGWQRSFSEGSQHCLCGVWDHALELISCFVHDTETSLSIQDETRVSAYIRTLMDIAEEPVSYGRYEAVDGVAPDYGYMLRNLLVSGLDETYGVITSD